MFRGRFIDQLREVVLRRRTCSGRSSVALGSDWSVIRAKPGRVNVQASAEITKVTLRTPSDTRVTPPIRRWDATHARTAAAAGKSDRPYRAGMAKYDDDVTNTSSTKNGPARSIARSVACATRPLHRSPGIQAAAASALTIRKFATAIINVIPGVCRMAGM